MVRSIARRERAFSQSHASPPWIIYVFALLNLRALSTHVCPYEGGWSVRIDAAVCPPAAPNLCGTGAQPRCCPQELECGGVDPEYGNWCCQSGYNCSQDALEMPKCANPDWTLYGKGGLVNSGAWCCVTGFKGFIQENNAVGCTEESQTALSSGWAFAPLVQTISCVSATASTTDSATTPSSTTQSATTTESQTTASSTSASDNQGNSALKPGEIAGIAIGAVGILVLICLAIILWKKRQSSNPISAEAADRSKTPRTDGIVPTAYEEPVFGAPPELGSDPPPPRELGDEERRRMAHELPHPSQY